MIWDLLMLQAMNGLVWGLIIALIALGLSIIFGLLDIVNVAHGELFMLGAVLAWTSVTVFGWVPGIFWFSLLIVPFILFVFGMGIERWVLRKIEDNASLSIVATFGLSLIFQEAVRATFGAAPKRVLPPVEATVSLFGFNYAAYRFLAAGIAVVAIAGLFLYLHKTQFGTSH
jgi:branched-chain amino acid transport system permease protein